MAHAVGILNILCIVCLRIIGDIWVGDQSSRAEVVE